MLWRGHGLWCVVRRGGRYPALLLLWCTPAATAPIQPLAWERPCAGGCGPHKTKQASNAISPNFWGGKLSILKASNTKGTEKMCYVELKRCVTWN